MKNSNMLILAGAAALAFFVMSKKGSATSTDYAISGANDSIVGSTSAVQESPAVALRNAPQPIISVTPSGKLQETVIRSTREGVAEINRVVSSGGRLISSGRTLAVLPSTSKVTVSLPSGKKTTLKGGTVSRLADGSVKYIGVRTKK